MTKKIFIILIFFLLVSTAVAYPKLKDFVTDNANIISEEYEQKIFSLAKQIEQETTAEIAVVTIESLEGISKEQYATELFEQAGIGKKDLDNGLLILIAPKEREYRVEVGYGLEHLIPDSSKVIIGTRILEPNFKQGEFGKGIYESLLTIQGLLKGQEDIISKYQSTYYNQQKAGKIKAIIYIIFIIIFIVAAIFRRKKGGSGFMFFPLFLGPRWNGGSGGFGSSGFGGFGGGISGGGGFGGSW